MTVVMEERRQGIRHDHLSSRMAALAEDKELAQDCWLALGLLPHDVESPEWLAGAALHLSANELPDTPHSS